MGCGASAASGNVTGLAAATTEHPKDKYSATSFLTAVVELSAECRQRSEDIRATQHDEGRMGLLTKREVESLDVLLAQIDELLDPKGCAPPPAMIQSPNAEKSTTTFVQYRRCQAAKFSWEQLVDSGLEVELTRQYFCAVLRERPHSRVLFQIAHGDDVDVEMLAKPFARTITCLFKYQDEPERLVPMFVSLGARHRRYGVDPSLLEIVPSIFVKCLTEAVACIGNGRTLDPVRRASNTSSSAPLAEELLEDWERNTKLATQLLLLGANSELGVSWARHFEAQRQTTLRKVWANIVAFQAANGNDFVAEMYRDAVSYFAKGVDIAAVQNLQVGAVDPSTTSFTRMALSNENSWRKVFDALTQIVANIDMPEVYFALLRDVAVVHSKFFINRAVVDGFEHSFIRVARGCVPATEWSGAAEEVLRHLWRLCGETILSASAQDDKKEEHLFAPRCAPVVLVAFEIEAAPRLWAKDPTTMSLALDRYHRMLLSAVQLHKGYVVQVTSETVVVAVGGGVATALLIAFTMQMDLLRFAPIAPHFKMLPNSQADRRASVENAPRATSLPSCHLTECTNYDEVWSEKTLRLRVAIQKCDNVKVFFNPISKRFDCFGSETERCAAIRRLASGGQVVMPQPTYEALLSELDNFQPLCSPDMFSLSMPPDLQQRKKGQRHVASSDSDGERLLRDVVVARSAGRALLPDEEEPTELVSLLPLALSGRSFPEISPH